MAPTPRSRRAYDTAVALAKSELSPVTAFMTGKVKIAGNMGMLLGLQNVLALLAGARWPRSTSSTDAATRLLSAVTEIVECARASNRPFGVRHVRFREPELTSRSSPSARAR